MSEFMLQYGRIDVENRANEIRGYSVYTNQGNSDKITTIRKDYYSKKPCENQFSYLCQRPAAALATSETSGKKTSKIFN